MSEVLGARLLASVDDRGWRVVDHRNGSAEILLGAVGTMLPLGELPEVAQFVKKATTLPKAQWNELNVASSHGVFCCACCDTRAIVLGQTVLRFNEIGLQAFQVLCTDAAAVLADAGPLPFRAAYALN